LSSAGKAAASASPKAPLSTPPRLSSKPMMVLHQTGLGWLRQRRVENTTKD
jgi:hypothetical protein